MMSFLAMQQDSRFDVDIRFIWDHRPYAFARNTALAAGRDSNVDWLVSCDNDGFTPGFTPLDIIASAGPNQNVISLRCGVQSTVAPEYTQFQQWLFPDLLSWQ